MRLCEEYLHRIGIKADCAVHVRRGFLYFDGGERLLSISWNEVGPHPGFYEFSECSLDTRCRVLSSERVDWEDYESHLISWKASAGGVVFDKARVFDLTWQYFLRRHEEVIMGALPLSMIHSTIDPSNKSRIVDCMSLVESLSSVAPEASEFWRSRAFDIISLYCHWLARL